MASIWGLDEDKRIVIEANEFGQPVGENVSKLTHFLGTIARNGTYAPIDILNWHKMGDTRKVKMYEVVESKFQLPSTCEEWILQSLGDKWRVHKSKTRQKYFDLTKPISVLMTKRPRKVTEEQWMNVLTYWKSEKAQIISNINKLSRSQKKLTHNLGKKSFAQVRNKKKKELNREPTRCEMFESCYSSKDEVQSSLLAESMAKMKEHASQLENPSMDTTGPDDSFAKVMGKDKPGTLRTYGLGVTPTDVYGKVPSRRIIHNKFARCQEEMREMRENFASQIAKLTAMIGQQNNSSENSQRQSSSIQSSSIQRHNQATRIMVGIPVVLKSIVDQSRVVEAGYVRSMDPSDYVGNEELGEGWSEVHVNIPFKRDERLTRSYDDFKTIGDVVGLSIAWPNFLIARDDIDF